MIIFYRTQRRLPRPGLHFDRGGERAVGDKVAKDRVQVAVEVARFVYDCCLDRGGQHRHCRSQVLQTDVGRRIVLFQGHVVWGECPKSDVILGDGGCLLRLLFFNIGRLLEIGIANWYTFHNYFLVIFF